MENKMKTSIVQKVADNPLRVRAIAFWAIAKISDGKGSCIIQDEYASLAAQFAREAGLNILHSPSYSVLKKYGRIALENFEKFGFESCILGANQRVINLLPKVQAGFEGLAYQPSRLEVVDLEHYRNIRNLYWIHLTESDAYQVLESSQNFLKESNPIFTIDLIDVGDKLKDIKALLSKLGYFSLDFLFENQTAFLIALPIQSQVVNLQSLLPSHEKGEYSPAELRRQVRDYYERLAHHPESSALLCQLLLNNDIELGLDQTFSEGLYECDSDGTIYWHWMGKSKESLIRLPNDFRGRVSAELHIPFLADDSKVNTVRVFNQGLMVFEETVESNQIIEFEVNLSGGSDLSSEFIIAPDVSSSIEGKNLSIAIEKLVLRLEERDLQ